MQSIRLVYFVTAYKSMTTKLLRTAIGRTIRQVVLNLRVNVVTIIAIMVNLIGNQRANVLHNDTLPEL